MDFTFTVEQQMLRDGLARYLAQHYTFEQRGMRLPGIADSGLWRQLGEIGLLALPLPLEAGGLGGSICDLVAIADLLGRHLVTEPFATGAVLAAQALALKREPELMEGIMQGTVFAAFAHEEGRGVARLQQVATVFDNGMVTGHKTLVLGAPSAAQYVVSARTREGYALVAVDAAAKGIALRSFRTIDGREAADVRFLGAPGKILITDLGAIDRLFEQAIILISAEAVGAMEALLEQTIAYAATRKQFGHAIGSFQAIAHRLADIKIACVKVRASLLYTAAVVEAEKQAWSDVSVLKAQVGRLGRSVAESAVQVHGGAGTTHELAIGHFLKRILVIDGLFGDCEFHFRQVGRPSNA